MCDYNWSHIMIVLYVLSGGKKKLITKISGDTNGLLVGPQMSKTNY